MRRKRKLRYLSVFSGIEAASLAVRPLGWKPVAFAETDPFCSQLLAERYPGVPNLGDVRRINGELYRGRVDVLCGGPPCQAFSVAGARNSLQDARGDLTLEFTKLADAVDAPLVEIENVEGILSAKDNAFGHLLGRLVGASDALPVPAGRRWPRAGVVAGPRRTVAWRVLDAQFFGVPQRRRRVWIIASAGNAPHPAAILFEPARQCESAAPRVSARKRPAGPVGSRARAACARRSRQLRRLARRVGLGSADDAVVFAEPGAGGSRVCAPTTRAASGANAYAGSGSQLDRGAELLEVAAFDETQITHPENRARVRAGDPAPTLSSQGRPPAVAFGGGQVSGALSVAATLLAHGARQDFDSETFVVETVQGENRTGPLTASHDASEDGTGRGAPLVALFQRTTFQGRGTVGTLQTHASKPVLPKGDHQYAILPANVRRLTPRECERLQGMPDDYTRLGSLARRPPRTVTLREAQELADYYDLPLETFLRTGAPPDGPRYKALGNSWPVPVARWIARRIELALWRAARRPQVERLFRRLQARRRAGLRLRERDTRDERAAGNALDVPLLRG